MSVPGAYDEMVSGANSLRPHWRDVMALVWGMPPEMLREKQARAVTHLAAADQFLPDNDETHPPGWIIDLLPLILPEAEWRTLSDGIAQRARLLNLVLEDIYGPQTLLKEKLLPPYLVFNNPRFLRPLRYVTARHAPPLHYYAADLVRMPDGAWRVLGDRTQAPGGIGYALRNRSVLARSFPEAFRNISVHRLQPTIDVWQASLQLIGTNFDDSPLIVLLTPGPHNAFYPEHVLLAHELGITLTQGSDLTVRDGMVYLKTLDGLARVHVIYRRVDGDYCDPLELRTDSALGVGGLIAAARAGNVAILNLPGSAVIETPAFASFLPAIARRLMDEELKLPAVTTWWCGQDMPLGEALQSPERFVFQPAFQSNSVPIDPTTMDKEKRARFLDRLKALPSEYVAVERVSHSRVPVMGEKGFEPRPVILRTSAISVGPDWLPLPGGVARIADPLDQRPALHLGGLVKDVWILKGEGLSDAARHEGLVELHKLHRVPDAVGSRVANDLFWFGRYMERIDSGLRQLRGVATRLTRGSFGPRDMAELELMARLLGATYWLKEEQARAQVDSALFASAIAGAVGPRSVLERYQLDLRQLGVALRDRLSQDMWRLVSGLGRAAPAGGRPDLDAALGVLESAILRTGTLAGLIADNMTRGMGWRFLEIGRRIERGILICSYVETLFADRPERVELSVRVLLELCDSIITHRRRFPMDSYTLPAVDVVLTDGLNPRALLYQLEALRTELDGLIGQDPLSAEKQLVDRQLGALRAPIPFADNETVERLDALTAGARACRTDLAELSDMITRSFFSHVDAVVLGVTGNGARQAS